MFPTLSLKVESELATSRANPPSPDTLLELRGEIGDKGAFGPPCEAACLFEAPESNGLPQSG